MINYSTPGVYTEEVPVFPPSIVATSTAIPAFIGYTEKAGNGNKKLEFTATRISTLLDFQENFGGPGSTAFSVKVSDQDMIEDVTVQAPDHSLYYAVDHYFKNGGGDCYIVSIGDFTQTADKDAFIQGLEALESEDEPTLIVLGEATSLDDTDYYDVCKAALSQCGNLKDRFCIIDVKRDNDVEKFRTEIGDENLKYGAAYTPFLQTNTNYFYDDQDVSITGSTRIVIMEIVVEEGLRITRRSDNLVPKLKINKTPAENAPFSISQGILTISGFEDNTTASEIHAAWLNFSGNKEGFEMSVVDSEVVIGPQPQKELTPSENPNFTLNDIRGTELYSRVASEIARQRIVLPPGAAVAGVYAKTDRERGIWKAPANVSLNAVLGPVVRISDAEQDSLNVNDFGKSINAIRSFTGKGTLVWGARTLDGNSNEWRYIPVRRLFNMVEESIKKATQFAVFESNDAVTWLKVKAMIQSFLYGIWQQGGLAGSTEEQAYFVNVGLGKTMTQQDILEGKMIFEIGLAATRPAEFIILKFSHKLQES
ncbi:MAG: phage tail sheath C-terminal domain-containing protein [Cyclobacteriaceae bacterium]